jgi:hypothetical protein
VSSFSQVHFAWRLLLGVILHLDGEQSLLQEYEPGRASNSAIADRILQHNRNLPSQQDAGAPGDLVLYAGNQLLPSGCNVPTQNEQLRIEYVQEAYQSGGQRLESEIEYATGTGIAIGRRLKNRFSAGNASGHVQRQLGWGRSMHMGEIF